MIVDFHKELRKSFTLNPCTIDPFCFEGLYQLLLLWMPFSLETLHRSLKNQLHDEFIQVEHTSH
jgi:hypothetical protein